MSATALVPHAFARHGSTRPADALITPTDPPRVHASGPAPHRLLVVGGGLLASEGVTTHELGLIGVIARCVAGLTGHGVDVDALVAGSTDVRSLARALRHRPLSAVDGLVLVVEPTGGAHRLEDGRRLSELLGRLRHELPPSTAITVALAPSAADPSSPVPADRGDDLRRSIAAPTRVVELGAARPGTSPRERFTAWGSSIATAVAEGLAAPLVWSLPLDDLDDRTRGAALRRLGPIDLGWEAMLQRLVGDAARAYGARSGAVTVLDGTRARHLAGVGIAEPEAAAEDTICRTALRAPGGVMVGDARADERFRDLPGVRDGAVRFYGGHRIEGPDGVPVAVLCVLDPEPREVRSQDIVLLRDLAHLAERRIREHRRRSVA